VLGAGGRHNDPEWSGSDIALHEVQHRRALATTRKTRFIGSWRDAESKRSEMAEDDGRSQITSSNPCGLQS
jgi:hypothetical protein